MASAAIDLLIGNIVSIVKNEASLLAGVRDELEEIKDELENMRAFLKDADRKGANTEVETTWVAKVRDRAYDVEDIVDEFMYHMNRQQRGGRFTRFLHQTIHFPKNLWARHQTATKLQTINKRIKAIPERSQRYGVDHIEGTSSRDDHKWVQNHNESSFFNKDDDLVGIEDESQKLVRWLIGEEPQLTVISVVGMGGSGKTTLVAKAYKSQAVKRHFDCYAWITVSQTYVIKDLFRSMIKEFFPVTKEEVPMDLSTMSFKQLANMLVNYLHQKRYVVVLDDVWNINLWKEINVSLPHGRLGSRVMLTTRKEDIASFSFGVGSHVHHVLPLGKNEAWALFCMKAFSSNPNRCCPRELEILAKELVEKCDGLPLAIVALGGVMSSKKLGSEWRQVYNSLNWQLSNNTMLEDVKSILLLSFNDLPYQLKQCFLYCCIFPEDCLIERKRLIRLWIAEGFVETIRGLTAEEVAESYLMELICRSMLQVVIKNPAGGPKSCCRMHDLLRELALSTSETEKFCIVSDGKEASEEIGARRLSIHIRDREIKSCKGISQLRTFFVFVADKMSPSSLNTLPSGFRLLRVLDLKDVPIDKLPDELVYLFNLRYLNLKRTQVQELPKSIGRLRNLQTLDIREAKIEVLPTGIVELQNLRHLLMYRYNYGAQLTDFNLIYGMQAVSNICKLKNLQVLMCVEADSELMKQVRNMTQLTRIGITKVREADEEDLCISIGGMKLLKDLFVMVTDEEESLRMDVLSSPPPDLRTLDLIGKLEKVPRWFNSLQSLTLLYLRWSRLREDPLHYIQELPNLGKLILVNAYAGEQLCFRTGFQKLTWLQLSNFPQLNEIFIEKGVMPSVQELYLQRCMELKMLPHGIEYLTNLQELDLASVSKELTQRIRGEESVDRPKVRHIPKINHYYPTQGGMFYESLSSFYSEKVGD